MTTHNIKSISRNDVTFSLLPGIHMAVAPGRKSALRVEIGRPARNDDRKLTFSPKDVPDDGEGLRIPLDEVADTLVAPEPTMDPIDAADFRRELDLALGTVSEREREAFTLLHEEERSLEEVAARMGATEEVAEALATSCAMKLRVLLRKFAP